jgi:hypothetical protein
VHLLTTKQLGLTPKFGVSSDIFSANMIRRFALLPLILLGTLPLFLLAPVVLSHASSQPRICGEPSTPANPKEAKKAKCDSFVE